MGQISVKTYAPNGSLLNDNQHTDERHQPSYVNFYIANGAVIMPGHGIPEDDEARAAVAMAFPDREVIQLQLRALPYGGGNIHCITQQQPSRPAGPFPLVSHSQG